MRSLFVAGVVLVACGSPVTESMAPSFEIGVSGPVAVVPAYKCKKLVCNFNASNSSDDTGIVSYTWHFLKWVDPTPAPGDGRHEYEIITTTSPTISYTFDCAGGYWTKLEVADADGNTAMAQWSTGVNSGSPWCHLGT